MKATRRRTQQSQSTASYPLTVERAGRSFLSEIVPEVVERHRRGEFSDIVEETKEVEKAPATRGCVVPVKRARPL
jgi:hypothetical protein